MDFKLSEDHLSLQEMFCDFAQRYVKPLAESLDEEERFPVETVKEMGPLGFFGIAFPEEYGGMGVDNLAYVLVLEEIAKCCATTAVMLSVSTLCATFINEIGNEEQRKKYLPRLLSGACVGAFALTEATAGSDASGLQAKAVATGDHYLLNGSKVFITNAGYAGLYIVMTITETDGEKGISSFIVEADTPGLSVGKKERKMGIRGSATCEITLDNCKVPKDNLLGVEGKGLAYALNSLYSGRIGIAAQALGIAQGAYDEAAKYVGERKQFGQRLSQLQETKFKLAEMATKIEAARFLVYRAACLKDAKEDFVMAASMAKLFASETANEVTREAVQLLGGYGYTRDYPVERMMRDAKVTEIYEGTSEVQKIVIARQLGIR